MTDMRSLKPALARLGRKLVSGTSWITGQLFGRFDWHAPTWPTLLGRQSTNAWRYFAADPKRPIVLALPVLTLVAGFIWYISRPKPHYVTYTVMAPGLTEYNERGISKIYPVKVAFSEAAAPL